MSQDPRVPLRYGPFTDEEQQVLEGIRSRGGLSCGDAAMDRLDSMFAERAERLRALDDKAKELKVCLRLLRRIEGLDAKIETRRKWVDWQTEILDDAGIVPRHD